jgi:hypothetical protein
LAASTGVVQHSPLLVTLAGAQHGPFAVGMSPAAQQDGPGLMGIRTTHRLLLAPPGAWPAGQHWPVEVAWLARQQTPPAST